MSLDYKNLIIKRFGWKRICKNTQCFGWILTDAVEHTETTVKTTYTGRLVGDEIHIDSHDNKTSKITVHLSFYRDCDDYVNLREIKILEIFYNIFFILRRILAFLLPIATLGVAIIFLMGKGDFLLESYIGITWLMTIFIWLGLIVLENIFAKIARKKLLFR